MIFYLIRVFIIPVFKIFISRTVALIIGIFYNIVILRCNFESYVNFIFACGKITISLFPIFRRNIVNGYYKNAFFVIFHIKIVSYCVMGNNFNIFCGNKFIFSPIIPKSVRKISLRAVLVSALIIVIFGYRHPLAKFKRLIGYIGSVIPCKANGGFLFSLKCLIKLSVFKPTENKTYFGFVFRIILVLKIFCIKIFYFSNFFCSDSLNILIISFGGCRKFKYVIDISISIFSIFFCPKLSHTHFNNEFVCVAIYTDVISDFFGIEFISIKLNLSERHLFSFIRKNIFHIQSYVHVFICNSFFVFSIEILDIKSLTESFSGFDPSSHFAVGISRNFVFYNGFHAKLIDFPILFKKKIREVIIIFGPFFPVDIVHYIVSESTHEMSNVFVVISVADAESKSCSFSSCAVRFNSFYFLIGYIWNSNFNFTVNNILLCEDSLISASLNVPNGKFLVRNGSAFRHFGNLREIIRNCHFIGIGFSFCIFPNDFKLSASVY